MQRLFSVTISATFENGIWWLLHHTFFYNYVFLVIVIAFPSLIIFLFCSSENYCVLEVDSYGYFFRKGKTKPAKGPEPQWDEVGYNLALFMNFSFNHLLFTIVPVSLSSNSIIQLFFAPLVRTNYFILPYSVVLLLLTDRHYDRSFQPLCWS